MSYQTNNNLDVKNIENVKNADLTYLIVGVVFFSMLVFLLIAAWIIIKLRTNKKDTIGFIFENNMHHFVRDFCQKHNLIYEPGGTFEYQRKMFNIDGIIITSKIILILEYKCYRGQLIGDATEDNLKLSDKNKKTIRISNPILQNQKHIEHLFKVFGYDFPVASMVVFEDGSSFVVKNVPDDVFIISPSMFEEAMNEVKEWSDSQPEEVINVKDFRDKLLFHKISSISQNLKWNKIINKKKQN